MSNDKLHIAYITTEYNCRNKIYGGLASYLNKTTQILQNDGHKCTVFTLADESFDIIEKNTRIIGIKESPNKIFFLLDLLSLFIFHKALLWIGKSFTMRKVVKKHAEQNTFSILQYCSAYGLGFFPIKTIPHCCRINSIKKVLNTALDNTSFSERAKATVELMAMRRFDFIFAPSNGTLINLEKITKQKGELINTPYIPLPKHSQDTSKTISWGDKYIVYLGTLNKLKGMIQISKIIESFLSNNSEFHFVFIGPEQPIDGVLPSQLIKAKTNLSERCHFLGRLEHQTLIPILRGAHASLISSLSENLPNTGIEAVCNLIPIVATHESNMGELISNGKNGFLYHATDHLELLNCLNKIAQMDTDERSIMVSHQKEVMSRYTPSLYKDRITSFYQEAIKSS